MNKPVEYIICRCLITMRYTLGTTSRIPRLHGWYKLLVDAFDHPHNKRVVLLVICAYMITCTALLSYINLPENRASPVLKIFLNSSKARWHTRMEGTKGKKGIREMVECYKKVYVWLYQKDAGKPLRRFLFRYKGQYSCPGLSCGVQIRYGSDYEQLAESDVVFLFYKSTWNWDKLMQYRSNRQRWIFWTYESPIHTTSKVIPPQKYIKEAYDYVMTYRTGLSNAKAVLSGAEYGRYIPHDVSSSPISDVTINWAANKTKLVAWVSSNCYFTSWDRTNFARALSRHISVDSFGECSWQDYDICENFTNCGIQKYKFYLAFENSECRDYITEKFWYNSLALGLVPIVYGAPKEDYVRLAPPNSFIHVQDFDSVSDLADYLIMLNKNDALYNKYFAWRKHGSVVTNEQHSYFEPNNLCRNVIGRILEDEKEGVHERPLRLDENWHKWWTNSCRSTCRYGRYPIRMD